MILKKQLTVNVYFPFKSVKIDTSLKAFFIIDWIERFFVLLLSLCQFVTAPEVVHARSCQQIFYSFGIIAPNYFFFNASHWDMQY